MSKSVVNAKAKALRKEKAVKKANRKKIIIASICVLVVIAAVVFTVILRNQNKETEIYSHDGQSVQLFADGTFSARLAHNTGSGTYSKRTEGNRTFILFNVNGSEASGYIENNALHLPHEWDDGHGHGTVFPRQN